ncbi:MFS transporter [Kribbella antibiotica]|uniref:MFS transporter n=1 Tax=Kribbella antibiotica TaxID=190195 RepID=A0A4R4YQC0_9ACTN|nr:MFS transporter [Kribbella antibiotica]TDD47341.1 MFS transporter [Kribbella antibiotica]
MSQSGVVPLRRNRPFAFFWSAQLLSNAGTQVSELAIPLIAVIALSAGPTEMGALTALESLPSLLLAVFLGVYVDRLRRGRLLFWANIGQGVLIGTVPLAAAFGVLTMGQLYLVTFAVGTLALAYGLAHNAYVPVLVTDRRQLTAANSSIALTDSVTAVAGPGLGGVLVQLLTAPIAIAVDAASFFVAAALQAAGRGPDPAPVTEKTHLRLSIKEGFAAFRQQPGIVAITLGKGSFDFFHWGVLALYILYAVRELGLSPAAIGLIAVLGSIGPLLAGVITTPISRRFGTTWTTVIAAILLGGELLIPFATGPKPLVLAMIGLGQLSLGLGVVYLIIIRATMLQHTVDPGLLGRVGSVIRLIEWGPGPLGGLTGGFLGSALGLRPALILMAAGTLTAVPWIAVAAARGHLHTNRHKDRHP